MSVEQVKNWLRNTEPHYVHLEEKDFDSNCELSHPLLTDKDTVLIVMTKASWCGHCKMATPALEQFAKQHKDNDNVVVAVIQSDSDSESEKKLAKRFMEKHNIRDFLITKRLKVVNL